MSSASDIDWNQVGISIGTGMAIAAGVLGVVNLIGLPVSYVLNRFVYHGTGMRILLAIVATILSIFILPCMLIYQGITLGTGMQKVHYFGFLPLIYRGPEKPNVTPDNSPMGWILPLVTPVWNFIRDTLLGGLLDHRDTPADVEAYDHAGEAILLPVELRGNPKFAILEQAVMLAQEAAQAPTKEQALALEEQQQALLLGTKPSRSATVFAPTAPLSVSENLPLKTSPV